MKNIIFALSMLLAGCSCSKKQVADLEFSGSAASFVQVQKKAFGGLASIENSFVKVGSDVIALHDPHADGSLFKVNLGPSGLEFNGDTRIAGQTRFTYVFEHDGVFYNFVWRDNDIYLLKSADLTNWQLINNGNPVLTSAPGTIYANVWNVGVAVDDNGVWHLLVECADGTGPASQQGGVGLAYSFATMTNDEINFDVNRTTSFVIPNGGNPDLKFVSGKGLLSIHGSLENGLWVVRASTFQNGTWTLHNDFYLGTPSIHVCDPSLVQLDDGSTLLSVSYDQNSIFLAKSPLSIPVLFDTINQ